MAARGAPGANTGGFQRVYADACALVLRHLTPSMQIGLAEHNQGWAEGAHDFSDYLARSEIRYRRALASIVDSRAKSVCDVGGFWGAFPIALRRLGYDVTMTEALHYYGPSFDGLFETIRSEGVRIVDYDPFGATRHDETYDYLSVMAVLEHYPHSLARFMGNLRSMLTPAGYVYIEVPNIAYWPKRWDLIRRGTSPLVPVETIWHSAVPFTGHHHEFTMDELDALAPLAGFTSISRDAFNYSLNPAPVRHLLRHPLGVGLRDLAFRTRPLSREILAQTWQLREAG